MGKNNFNHIIITSPGPRLRWLPQDVGKRLLSSRMSRIQSLAYWLGAGGQRWLASPRAGGALLEAAGGGATLAASPHPG